MEKNYREVVLDIMRERIVYMHYQPGDELKEKNLCEEFKVSRTPVREALIELRTLGLVDIFPRSGTYVSKIDLGDLKNCYMVKSVLEGFAAQLAAENIRQPDLEALEQLLETAPSVLKPGEYEKAIQVDNMFHEILYANTHNQALLHALQQIQYKCLRGWFSIIEQAPNTLQSIRSLADVLDALKRKDAKKARETMEDHVLSFIELGYQPLT